MKFAVNGTTHSYIRNIGPLSTVSLMTGEFSVTNNLFVTKNRHKMDIKKYLLTRERRQENNSFKYIVKFL